MVRIHRGSHICLHRLVVRTPGFHPGNGGSIPPGDTLIYMLSPDFSKTSSGLLPVIVQDYKSNQILMLAYINEEAWQLSLKNQVAIYWSRSRNRLWKKGEISGHTQEIKEILIDCDEDTLIFKVKQKGSAACHQGYRSCFYRQKVGNNFKKIAKPLINVEKLYQK